MIRPEDIYIKEFTYDLLPERIAKYPLENRDASKLLVYKNDLPMATNFGLLHEWLENDSLLVFNNTKVIRARLVFAKSTGAKIEIFCLEPHAPADYVEMFQSREKCEWQCLIGNRKRWKHGELNLDFVLNGKSVSLFARRVGETETADIVEFSWNEPIYFAQVLEANGSTPIPPYLNRKSEVIDQKRYQTVYSKHKGSVAAPTAGLHFTENVFKTLNDKNIKMAELTLHVGAGTFRPVDSATVDGHDMHSEFVDVSVDVVKDLIRFCGKTAAVGTTSVRTLESLYWMGVKLLSGQDFNNIDQWVYLYLPQNFSLSEALYALVDFADKECKERLQFHTSLMIVPGYKYQIVNRIITNFHQPQSTLLLLVAAFVGKNWKSIYEFALENNFRFLSYGDSSLLFPEGEV